MGLGGLHKWRRVASAFALAGIVLFTWLVPGHLVSQATAFARDAAPGAAHEMPCHEDMAMPAVTPDPNNPEPDAPQSKCPFCKGYAAFMNVLLGEPDTGAIDAERVTIAQLAMDDGAIEHIAKQTKNRGPPRLL